MDYNTYQSLDLAEVHFSDDKYSHQLFNLYLHLDVNEFAILSKFGHDHDMTYRTSHHVPWGYYTVQFKRYSRKYQSLYYGLFELERKIPHIDYTAIYILMINTLFVSILRERLTQQILRTSKLFLA